MKKIVLSLVAVAAMFTSCTQTELAPNAPQSREVSFLAANMTRVEGDKFEEGDKVKVAAFEESTLYKTAQYTYDGGNKFISNAAIAYRDDAQALSFYATYPELNVTASTFDFSVKANQSAAADFEASDLLVATVEKTQSLSPAFVFGHKMANINVALVVKNGGSAAVENFAFNMIAEAECDAFKGTYTAKANASEVKITPSANSNLYSVIVPAQSVAANCGFAQVEIGGKTYKVENAEREFLSGKRYMYTWTIDVATGAQTLVIGNDTTGGDGGTTTPDVSENIVLDYGNPAGFPTSPSATASTVDINGTTFEVKNAYYSTEYGSYNIDKEDKADGYFVNTTPLVGLTKVIITAKDNYRNFRLYQGNTLTRAAMTEAVYEKNGYVYTFFITDDCEYIKIAHTGSNYDAYFLEAEFICGEDTDGGDQGGGDVVLPDINNNTKYPYMPELPEENLEMAGDYYYAYHNRADAQSVRNFAVCYSKEKMCPIWVAAPMHACYKGSSGRNDSYKNDPKIPFTQAPSWDGYTRGHMLGSSDRTISVATNQQVFYLSNIGPQLGYVNGGGFNTGGGVWNNLEDYTDGQWCSDTLYQVVGCYWANERTKVDRTTIPTHYYKVLLRTKSGNSGKNVQNCSADELKCVAFIVEHNTDQHKVKPHAGMMRSVAEMEEMTGLTFFSNVPNAPKDSYSKSDWGM